MHAINLCDSGNTINSIYLKQLDAVFEKKRLIGLGESTHGTSEFTLIRGELFKYLVKNHNYTAFFLEADFNACSRVNRYIHQSKDDSKEALLEVRLWPWLTEELLELIEWMRIYNQNHDNILEFIGCDMQLIADDRLELPRILSSNSKYHEYLPKLPNLDFETKDTSLLISKSQEWSEFSDEFLKAFPNENHLRMTSVSQWFENELSKGFKENFRDSCMAMNIADYLEERPKVRGIYFAHNGHVGKITNHFPRDMPVLKRAGHFLDERLGNHYFAIALEFNTGSFNAINYLDEEYVMEYFTINKRNRKSLAHHVLRKDDKIKYLSANSIPSKKYLKINSIGAIYGKSKTGQKIHRYRRLDKVHYDAFIVINKGTPTKLLTFDSRKSKDYK